MSDNKEVTLAYQPPIALQPAIPSPLDMLNRAVATGASMDLVERLMGLYERWEAAKARKSFDAAIAAAKALIKPAVKSSIGHNAKKYADFASYAREVDPVLAKHGLGYRFRTVQTDRITVTCVLFHEAGHREENTLSGPPDTTGNKNAIQAIGSTLTYLQRYSLIQALGLAAADDDDGNAAGDAKEEEKEISFDQAVMLQKMIEELPDSNPERDVVAFLKFLKIPNLKALPLVRYDEAERELANVRDIRTKKAKAKAQLKDDHDNP